MRRLLFPILLFALFFACRESDQYRGINYEPNASRELSTITIQACFDNEMQPIEGYFSVCVFLDPEFQHPWRTFAGNNVCWATNWHMRVPTKCWIVVFIDAEPLLPDDDGIIELGPFPWKAKTEWDGIPDIGDPYHPTIIEHGNLEPLHAVEEVVDGDLVVHYELGDFDRSHRWGMHDPS